MSLKVVKFDTKMYLNFSIFRGRTSAGGGQALVQKRGQVSDGGIDKIFAGCGPPQEKTLRVYDDLQIALVWCHMKPSIVSISKPYEIDNIATQLGKAIKNISGDGDELYRGYGSNSLGLPLKVIDAVSGQTEFKYVSSSSCAYIIRILGTTKFACGFFFFFFFPQWCVCTYYKIIKVKKENTLYKAKKKKKKRQKLRCVQKGSSFVHLGKIPMWFLFIFKDLEAQGWCWKLQTVSF